MLFGLFNSHNKACEACCSSFQLQVKKLGLQGVKPEVPLSEVAEKVLEAIYPTFQSNKKALCFLLPHTHTVVRT
jgi:hypothetical protein